MAIYVDVKKVNKLFCELLPSVLLNCYLISPCQRIVSLPSVALDSLFYHHIGILLYAIVNVVFFRAQNTFFPPFQRGSLRILELVDGLKWPTRVWVAGGLVAVRPAAAALTAAETGTMSRSRRSGRPAGPSQTTSRTPNMTTPGALPTLPERSSLF